MVGVESVLGEGIVGSGMEMALSRRVSLEEVVVGVWSMF